eukprot:CAMPEP_0170494554 /NCGR_PEP_ID=MMETSP0208-20121228/14708_1 /TAXON_ID=197538 /ORGANISM="Strombidium inclinatum, Strain S3" /LENGTH=52 /DNA_ID=CAMNT_0010770627 /DNA_START=1918 /DNA_END=2076 /DNA_ORIENTATION=-
MALYIWRQDADFYLGEFNQGEMEGFGIHTNFKERTRYAGSFRDGVREGIGLH